MMQKGIIDSGVWISQKSRNDPYAEKGRTIMEAFANGDIANVYITNYVLQEVVNFLLRKASFEKALETYEMLKEQTNVVFVAADWEAKIKELFEKYKALSITDCSILVLAEKFGIRNVFSFDKGFDMARFVVRKEEYGD